MIPSRNNIYTDVKNNINLLTKEINLFISNKYSNDKNIKIIK